MITAVISGCVAGAYLNNMLIVMFISQKMGVDLMKVFEPDQDMKS